MKKIIFAILVSISAIAAVAGDREGVWKNIDPAKVQDLLEWATSSKAALEGGKASIVKLPLKDRRSAYRILMTKVVESSGVKQNELLMRVSLNRGLEVDEILTETTKQTEESDSLKRRLLKEAIDLAIQVFQEDANFLNGVQGLDPKLSAKDKQEQIESLSVPQAHFEVKSAAYLKERAINATSHEGTYQLLKFAITQLYNGLDNSLHRRFFAKPITKIAEVAAGLPEHAPLDPSQALTLNRNLKSALDEIVQDAEAVKIIGGIVTHPGGQSSGRCGNNPLGMSFSCIPAGEFIMGSPSSEPGHNSDEIEHKVKISRSFEMQMTEVTEAQWEAVMGSNPSNFKGANRPVENVSWDDVQGFITKFNQRRDGYTYRLPTEAEWEYAARARTTTMYSFGSSDQNINQNAWYGANSGSGTHDVASIVGGENGFGLYDMHGNVWEWVQDAYQKDISNMPSTDPIVSAGSFRVFRGGGWVNTAQNLRSARRYNISHGDRFNFVGFRLVRTT